MMRHTRISLLILLIAVVSLLAGCPPPQTSDDIKREQQERSLAEGNMKVGMPGIINFRQAKIMRMIQELCDQEIVTYTYVENMMPRVVPGLTARGGKFTYIGETIGFPLPYASQFTAPESMQSYNLKNTGSSEHRYGVARLPQADPDGLFKPGSAEGSWVLMKDPKSDKVSPFYSESRLTCFTFKLEFDGAEQAAAAKATQVR
jgi:hypothetical protein